MQTTIKNLQDRMVQLDWFPPNGKALKPNEEVILDGRITDYFKQGTGQVKLASYTRDVKEGLVSVVFNDVNKVVPKEIVKEKPVVSARELTKVAPCREITTPVITNAPAEPAINPCQTGKGSVTVVIPYSGDKQLIPLSTGAGNYQDTGLSISQTPVGGGYVGVSVNGLEVYLADGQGEKDAADCYFSGDGGVTARAMSAIVAGDELYWNNLNTGYVLDKGDSVDFYYMYSTVNPCP